MTERHFDGWSLEAVERVRDQSAAILSRAGKGNTVSAFFVVEAGDYSKHWATFDQALADYLRLLNETEAEDITLRFSA